MKYIALVCLVIQNAALILLMRYTRTRPGDKFLSSTAVVVSEVMKLIVCLIIILYECKGIRLVLFSKSNKSQCHTFIIIAAYTIQILSLAGSRIVQTTLIYQTLRIYFAHLGLSAGYN